MNFLKKPLDIHTLDAIKLALGYEPKCDFCGDPNPMYVYGANRMSNGLNRQCWRWCACWTCANHVDNADWDDILAKIVIKLRRMLPNVPAFQIEHTTEVALQEFHSYAIKKN